MSFGKKAVQSTNTSNSNLPQISGDEWNAWNTYLNEEVIEGEWVKQPNGKFKKEVTAVGVLNFIFDIGTQKQGDASMESKLAKPADGEEYSAEELAEMDKYPNNYFRWVEEYKNNTKVRIRKKFWPKQPESELIFAVDFPALKVDYSKHPAAQGVGEVKPLRIDYNGKDFKDKSKLGRNITNEVNYKTGKFGDKDIKYKIATAAGVIEDYMKDGHDLKYLVQATCNWTIQVTKTIADKDGKEVVYYNQKILDPSAVEDIKFQGKVVVSKEDQLSAAQTDVPFCGILMNGGEYPEENLKQVRDMWWEIAKQATTFDRNLGSNREGEWICGEGWEGSDLQKAYDKLGLGKSSAPVVNNSPQKASQEEYAQPQQSVTPQESKGLYNEPPIEFDDNIPFAPVGLQYSNHFMHVCA